MFRREAAAADDDLVANNIINPGNRPPPLSTSRIVAYFHTLPVTVTEARPLNLHETVAYLNYLVEEFTRRGSGFVLDYIIKLTGVFVRYRPLGGNSYVQTPEWLVHKHAVVNVKNLHSDDCFRWSILSACFRLPRTAITFLATRRTATRSTAAS